MQKQFRLSILAGAVLAVITASAWSADAMQSVPPSKAQPQTQKQIRDRDIYGHQLMTVTERKEYRAKMRTAKTAEERERIRAEHHTQMQIRAKERGVTIPDEPPANRGPGSGMGGGKGPGGGMGSGGSK